MNLDFVDCSLNRRHFALSTLKVVSILVFIYRDRNKLEAIGGTQASASLASDEKYE